LVLFKLVLISFLLHATGSSEWIPTASPLVTVVIRDTKKTTIGQL